MRTVMIAIVSWPARQAACYNCPGCSRWKGEASQTNWCRRTAGERDGTFVWVAMLGATMVAVPDSLMPGAHFTHRHWAAADR